MIGGLIVLVQLLTALAVNGAGSTTKKHARVVRRVLLRTPAPVTGCLFVDYRCSHEYRRVAIQEVAVKAKNIGDVELDLLRYIGAMESASVGEAVSEFGDARGLARSTVLTMMERLRTKGFLKRRRSDGVYRYSATRNEDEVVQNSVSAFIENTLKGSVSPLFVWMSRRGRVSDEELASLAALVEKLQSSRKGD